MDELVNLPVGAGGEVRCCVDPSRIRQPSRPAAATALILDALFTPLGYRGEWTDATTGQQYLRARHYDPKVGRFTSLDPRDAGPGDLGNANLYVYAANDPINFADPTGLFTQQQGYLAEQAIRPVYERDHAADVARGLVSFGGWARLPGGYRLKPDIMNHAIKSWIEIKPLTLSGIAAAGIQFAAYSRAFGPDYAPEATWNPSTNYAVAGSMPIFFFNAGGIVFYTDVLDATEDLLALTSLAAVRAFMHSAAGQALHQSVMGALSRVPALVASGRGVDNARLTGQFNISTLISSLSGI